LKILSAKLNVEIKLDNATGMTYLST
jgi:hypothetical protein